MSDQNEKKERFKVFLSYSSDDKEKAQKIYHELIQKNINVWLDDYELSLGDSLIDRIKNAISASDYMVVILSKNSVKSTWMSHELGHYLYNFSRRDITLLPVRVDNCEIPLSLTNYKFLDLRNNFDKGVEKLVDSISAVPEVDFSKLTERKFEELIAELFRRLGFENVVSVHGSEESGIDLKAEHKRVDLFGQEIKDSYVIQVKLYRKSRPDIRSLQQSLVYLKNLHQVYQFILVTNSQLTSAASDWLKSTEQEQKIKVRVVDGTELKRLLLRHSDLVKRYLSADEGAES
jgi:hypothetical protein